MNLSKKILVFGICAAVVYINFGYYLNGDTQKEIKLLIEEIKIKKSDMVKLQITSEKKKIIEEASEKLIKIGEPVIPHLLKILKQRPPKLRFYSLLLVKFFEILNNVWSYYCI